MDAVIRVETFPNDRIREFHINRVISSSRRESFERPLRKSSEEYLKHVGELGSRLVRAALRLPGVTEVGIQPYTFRIEISKAHDWSSIQESIVRLLESEVFPGVDPSAVQVGRA